MRRKRTDAFSYRSIIQVFQLSIDELHLMAGSFDQDFRIAEFQRKVRFATTKVDAAVETPRRINE